VKRRLPRPVKQLARSTLREYARRTAAARALPDFLVIGVKRGGTTSVWNWLVRHPHVAPMFPAAQQIKSPHYFDISYANGLDWYRSHFPTRAALDRIAERTGFRPLTGEASPYYVFHPLAAARVQETLPAVKLIVTLRNPVDRAYSNYWERRGSDAEPLDTFEAALDAEPERLAGEAEKIAADPAYYSRAHDCHSYLARGRYTEHLGAWSDRFGPDQLLVLPFDELRVRPVSAYRQIQTFLGLPLVEPPELPHHNKLPVPPMLPETRERLVEYYRPWNAALRQEYGLAAGWDH
jgi:hypothetical protein